ncbi:MAG: hypothetical protein ACTSWK_00245 [Promethearchaeota archaeon]
MENPCETCLVKACCKIQCEPRFLPTYNCELYEEFKLFVFCNYGRKSTKLKYNRTIIYNKFKNK